MDLMEFAGGLVNSDSPEERGRMLKSEPELLGVELARAVKEVCYDSWTNEPKAARAAESTLDLLLRVAPEPEIRAIYLWISGIAEISRGRLESAVEALEESSQMFLGLGKEADSAQTNVAKLIPLALLGKYPEAKDAAGNALAFFEAANDRLAAGKIEMNLSNISARQGHYAEAERFCLSALGRFTEIGEKEWKTLAENDLANTYYELNDFEKADEYFARALSSARSSGMEVTEAEIEASMGNLATFRGRYGKALRLLELSRQRFESLEMPHQCAIADLEIAEIYQTLNLNAEAAEIYSRVAGILEDLKLQGEEARARLNLGQLLLKKREYEDARRELRTASVLFANEKNKTGAFRARLLESRLETALGNLQSASDVLDLAHSENPGMEDQRLLIEANYIRGLLYFRTARHKEAEEVFAGTRRAARSAENRDLEFSSINSLGLIALANGDEDSAKGHFLKAVEMIESMRAPIAADEFRMSFLADKTEPFEKLASIFVDEGNIGEAFLFTERARSRTLVEKLRNSGVPQTSGKEEQDKRLERLREELNWYYARMNDANTGERVRFGREAAKREKEIAIHLRRQGAAAGAHGAGRDLSPDLSVPELQESLGRERALLAYTRSYEDLGVYIVTNSALEYLRLETSVSKVSRSLEALRFQFGTLRYGSETVKKHIPELKRRADGHLADLYDALIRPVEDKLGGRDLLIIPASILHYVPFPALFDGERYVAEHSEVVYAPSAAVWQTLASRPFRVTDRALVVGFADQQIPLVGEEVRAVSRTFPEAETLFGDDANFEAFCETAPRFPVIHLACHGRFRADNPLYSSLQLANGAITVRDICSRPLNAELVTLSACETGLSKVVSGDEILGLARGFLEAGVNSLVLSIWTVNDEATAVLMTGFYRNLQRGATVSASLNEARRSLIKRGMHPYFWAAFGIMGR